MFYHYDTFRGLGAYACWMTKASLGPFVLVVPLAQSYLCRKVWRKGGGIRHQGSTVLAGVNLFTGGLRSPNMFLSFCFHFLSGVTTEYPLEEHSTCPWARERVRCMLLRLSSVGVRVKSLAFARAEIGFGCIWVGP